LKNPISSLRDKITQYIRLRFELVRLEVIERLVNVMGYFAFIIIAIFLCFLSVFFVCLALGKWLGALFHNDGLGYFCVSLLVLLASVFVFLSSKKIIRFFAGKMAWLLTKQKERNIPEEDEASEE